jgi:cytochrome c553
VQVCRPSIRAGWPVPEYTEAQLKAFRVEERANDPEKMMRMIAAKLSDVEIKAVAEYAAGLR